MIGWFSDRLWISFLYILPFQTALKGREGMELHFLRKEALRSHSRGGGCSLSSSLFPAADWCWQPFTFQFTGTVQGSALSLGAEPISGLLLGAESSSAETGDIYTLPLPNKTTHSRQGEKALWSEALRLSPWRKQITWPLEDHRF